MVANPKENTTGKKLALLSLIFSVQSKVIELRACTCRERQQELRQDLGGLKRQLDNIDENIFPNIVLLVNRNIQPFFEYLNNNLCPHRNLKLHSSLIQKVRLLGIAVCEHCSRIILSSV